MAKKTPSTIGEDPLDALIPFDPSIDDAEEESTASAKTKTKAKSEGANGGGGRQARERRTSKGTAASRTEDAPMARKEATTSVPRELQRINKELQVRVRELELELAGGPAEDDGLVGDDSSSSEESDGIISMVRDLHEEIDAAYELRTALEADLAATQKKLAAEESFRAESDARLRLLEAKAALGDQLREDISFVEEERDEMVRRLDAISSELKQATEERDTLAEQKTKAEVQLKEIQADKIGLSAKVLNLEETVSDMDRLRNELDIVTETSQRLEDECQNLKGKLEGAEISKNALELDVTTTREIVRGQNEQIEELKDNLNTAHTDLADLRAKLDRQEIKNANLQEVAKRSEREVKTLNARNESLKKELDASKKALRDIHNAAIRTTSRVRDRHSNA